MLALALALLMQAAAPPPPPTTEPSPPAKAEADAPPPKPADISHAVDANGVPSWAKRKHKSAVLACETKVNIGVDTWRQLYHRDGRVNLNPPPAKCR